MTIVFVRRTNTEDKGVTIPRTKLGPLEGGLGKVNAPAVRLMATSRRLIVAWQQVKRRFTAGLKAAGQRLICFARLIAAELLVNSDLVAG